MRLPKIDRLLTEGGELQPLLARTREIRAFAGLVDGFLPPDLARQVRVANVRDGELVLLAANAAVAAKLRLLAPSLSRYLLSQRRQVNSVSVRVQPTMSRPSGARTAAAAARKSAHFSTEALAALRALYEGMADSPAREALRVLLERDAAKERPAGAPQRTAGGPAESRKRRT